MLLLGQAPSMRRFLKRVVWSLIPVLVLLTSAELVVRLKYFFAHKRDWNYLTMPYRVQDTQALDHAFFKLPEKALEEAAAAASKEAAPKTPAPSAPAQKPALVPAAAAPTPAVDLGGGPGRVGRPDEVQMGAAVPRPRGVQPALPEADAVYVGCELLPRRLGDDG